MAQNFEETRKNIRVGQVIVRLPTDRIRELDRIVADRSTGGVVASRQSLVAAWIERGLREAAKRR
jgi:hypothetical protein